MATEPTTDERPMRADARRNRARILDAARCVCAKHGAAVQMDDVARSAGVGVGTVYRHFPTKDALIEALVAEKIRMTTENLREALEIEDPWEAFVAAMRRNTEVMAADAALREALIRLGPAARASEAQYAEVNEVAGRLIGRAQAAGVLRDDVTTEDVGALIGGLCASMAHPELDWRRHLDVLLDGLRARGADRPTA
jgi:AcrR family transcriptional regulator